MGHQIRRHMVSLDGDTELSGEVEINETMMGGRRRGKCGRGADSKTVVFGMMERKDEGIHSCCS